MIYTNKSQINKSDKTHFFSRKAPWYTKALRISLLAIPITIASPTLVELLPNEDLPASDKETFQKYFQNSLDYSQVKTHNSFISDTYLKAIDTKGLALGNTIFTQANLILDANYEYIKMHELTHIWQYQNCGSLMGTLKEIYNKTSVIISDGDAFNHYNYDLGEGKDLLKYNIEQQASILADYFWLNTHEKTQLNRQGSIEKKREQYKKTLNNFLKNPNYIKNNCDFG